MYQYDDPTAVVGLPTPAAPGTGGYFTDGNPTSGSPATILRADFMNMVMEELLNVVTAAGITPSKTAYNQVLLAIQAIIAAETNDYVLDTGAANAYVCALSPPITSYVNGQVVKFRAVHANTGASTLNAGGGVVALVREDGAALQSGDIPGGGLVVATYDTPTGHFFLTAIVPSQLLTQIQQQTGNYAADSGTVNALAVTLTPAPSALTAGLVVRVKVANTNTAAATLNVNGLAATAIKDTAGNALRGGEMAASSVSTFVYDGTYFELQSPWANTAALFTGVYAADTSGTPNQLVASVSPGPTALSAGLTVRIKVANTVTGAATLNLNGLGAVAIHDTDGNAMHAGALIANSVYQFTHDGTYWELQSPAADTMYAEGGSYAADTGAVNAYAASVTPISALAPGIIVRVKIVHTNTGASTFALNSLGAVAVVLKGGQALSGGELVAGAIVDFEYDGTNWQASGAIAYLDIGAGLRNDGSGNLQVNEAVSGQSGAQTINGANHSKYLISTAATTFNLARSNTLWNGWGFPFNAAGGAITFAPNANDTINVDGVSQGLGASFTVPQGGWGDMTSDAAGNINIRLSSGRIRLNANISIYVATTGSDSANTGLSVGSPFATLQKAWNFLQANYDLNGFVATVNIADGTYSAGLNASGAILGAAGPSSVAFVGNVGSPANVLISTAANAIVAGPLGQFSLSGMKIATSAQNGIAANGVAAQILIAGAIAFGACAVAHFNASAGGEISIAANYTIAGNAQFHWYALSNGIIVTTGALTITLTGTPAFSSDFALASLLGSINVVGLTFSGSATGTRYSVSVNAAIYTNGAGSTYLPGNAAGATATGGQYA